MDLLWPQLRPSLDSGDLLPLLVLFGVMLGYLVWSDLFRDRYVPDRVTLPLLAAAFVAPPLLFENLWGHYLAAIGITAFVLFAWFIGAWADGDLKILVGYALLLGLAALPIVVLACFVILLYSLPIMLRAWKERSDLPRGQRLGTAPGVPGIALALPLGFLLWGEWQIGALLLALSTASFLLAFLWGRRAPETPSAS